MPSPIWRQPDLEKAACAVAIIHLLPSNKQHSTLFFHRKVKTWYSGMCCCQQPSPAFKRAAFDTLVPSNRQQDPVERHVLTPSCMSCLQTCSIQLSFPIQAAPRKSQEERSAALTNASDATTTLHDHYKAAKACLAEASLPQTLP